MDDLWGSVGVFFSVLKEVATLWRLDFRWFLKCVRDVGAMLKTRGDCLVPKSQFIDLERFG